MSDELPPEIDEPPARLGPELDPAFRELVGQRMGDYEVLRVVGHGSMGVVYEAHHPRLDRRVALKVLPPRLGDAGKTIQRFLREAQAVAQLEHESIVNIYDIGEVRGTHYYAMQFLDGEPVDQALRRTGVMTAKDAARITEVAARAVHFAHQHGIIHRDIKPANIIRQADGRVILTDFGLARKEQGASLTDSGAMVGTPLYMSPEQVRGERAQIDRRTDVYSLGATLYELMTGCAPHRGGSTQEILYSILEEEPRRARKLCSSVPRDLETIAMRALEKNRDKRYKSALEMAEDLRRFQEGEPILARRTRITTRVYRQARKHRGVTALLIVLFLMTLAWLAVTAQLDKTSEEAAFQEALNAGRAALELGDWVAAEGEYERAYEQDPSRARTLSRLGLARSRLGLGMTWKLQIEQGITSSETRRWEEDFVEPAGMFRSALEILTPILDDNVSEAGKEKHPLAHLCASALRFQLLLHEVRGDGDPERIDALYRRSHGDLEWADETSRQQRGPEALETQCEIARQRVAIATEFDLSDEVRDSQLQRALTNVCYALEHHPDRLAGNTSTALGQVYRLRAQIFRHLFSNSTQELDLGFGGRDEVGIPTYLDHCQRDAQTALQHHPTDQLAANTLRWAEEMKDAERPTTVPGPGSLVGRDPPEEGSSDPLGAITRAIRTTVTNPSQTAGVFAKLLDQGTRLVRDVGDEHWDEAADQVSRLIARATHEGTPSPEEAEAARLEKAREVVLRLRADRLPLRGDARLANIRAARDTLEATCAVRDEIVLWRWELAYLERTLARLGKAREHWTAVLGLSPCNPYFLHSAIDLLLEIAGDEELPEEQRVQARQEALAHVSRLDALYPGERGLEALRRVTAGDGLP